MKICKLYVNFSSEYFIKYFFLLMLYTNLENDFNYSNFTETQIYITNELFENTDY